MKRDSMSFTICPTYSRFIQYTAGGWATGVSQSEKTSLPRRGKRLSSQTGFSSSEQIQPLEPMQPSYECLFLLDDTETRTKIWNLFFENTPLPEPEDNAVEKYYGLLDKFVGKKKIPKGTIERILEEV